MQMAATSPDRPGIAELACACRRSDTRHLATAAGPGRGVACRSENARAETWNGLQIVLMSTSCAEAQAAAHQVQKRARPPSDPVQGGHCTYSGAVAGDTDSRAEARHALCVEGEAARAVGHHTAGARRSTVEEGRTDLLDIRIQGLAEGRCND